MTDQTLVEAAKKMLADPHYLADARRHVSADNSIAGGLLAISANVPRWAAEDAVRAALRSIKKQARAEDWGL